ncbi:alpha-L-fucosidase [Luteolibacter ambystomatis]|uniref:alpha-L-fucosidase n=1 Tax=Luteolibacter ambystomatis TaxID=2824561 RepID=A0A975J0A9_9BACT|nr:alpha-L-fucosidase [Luteolibacter ambystomatis]QUE51666.1 alpha-L-fucosidase [Luteolibacter ambystomatis]
MTSLVHAGEGLAPKPNEPWAKPDPASLKAWQDSRFGMFIHWGPCVVGDTRISWSRGESESMTIEKYDNLYKKLEAPKLDVNGWVATAKAAGMKYIVFTSKHHDGFSMWDTKQSDYNVMHSPLARDVVKALSEACHREGMPLGIYYSVCDWHQPDFPRTSPAGTVRREKSDQPAYRRYMEAQLTELVKNYGPLQSIWFDVPQEFNQQMGWENVKFVRRLQPDILINNRAGGGAGDFSTPEQKVGGFNMKDPWETCMTVSRGWSWRSKDETKPLKTCLRSLIQAAGGNGNFLFNVSPKPDGTLEPEHVERLKEMGAWMQANGESIYGTQGGPYMPAKHLVSTRKVKTIYLHVLDWPEDTLTLPPLPAKVLSSRVLTGGEVTLQQTDGGLKIQIPKTDRKEIDTIIALEIDKPASDMTPIPVESHNVPITEGKKGSASSVRNIFGNVKRYSAASALDGRETTRWTTEVGVHTGWMEVDLGSEQTFDRAAIIVTASTGKRFTLEYKKGDVWETFHEGKSIDPGFSASFTPVTARYVRLNIRESANEPSICEFQLFAPAERK